MKYLLGYLLGVNLALFALMGVDKYKAVHGKWRVRESTLFVLAIIGGSIGSMMTCMADCRALSREDIEELYAILRAAEQEAEP